MSPPVFSLGARCVYLRHVKSLQTATLAEALKLSLYRSNIRLERGRLYGDASVALKSDVTAEPNDRWATWRI